VDRSVTQGCQKSQKSQFGYISFRAGIGIGGSISDTGLPDGLF
jgi:hypothetical protein